MLNYLRVTESRLVIVRNVLDLEAVDEGGRDDEDRGHAPAHQAADQELAPLRARGQPRVGPLK